MKSSAKGLRKFLKRAGIFLLALLLLLLAVRAAGRLITGRTPKGGINDSFFTDINGQEMWFSVYSEDPSLPVLLYLHGGPGMSTSFGDWVILRKLAKDYTVVNWDQRNCGKTWIHDPQDTPLTPELLRSDLLSAVQYILDYTGREKLTLLGNSWGTMYGCDFALSHPELVDCVINTSMSVDICESDRALKSLFLEWSENDPEYHALAEQFDPNGNLSEENNEIFYKLAEKFVNDGRISQESYFDGDVNPVAAVYFNPYYSLWDLIGTVRYLTAQNGMAVYNDAIYNTQILKDFSVFDRTEYAMPVYFLEGTQDYQALYVVAEAYYQSIQAPDKELRLIEGGGHLSTMLESETLAAFVHEAAQRQKTAGSRNPSPQNE